MIKSLVLKFEAPLLLVARLLMAYIFIVAGYGKITGYAGTAGFMDMLGVPSALLPLTILVELGGGLLILFGVQTSATAIVLAGFCVVSGLLFHFKMAGFPAEALAKFNDNPTNEMINFMKNLNMTGGFIALALTGAGAWSIDGLFGRK